VDFGVDVHRIEILVMGVPDLSHQWSKRMNNDDTIRVLFAGEMSERKGLPNLLEAMSDSQLAQYRLSVAGSGSIEHWKEFVKSKPAEKRINFLGHIPVDGVHEELSRTDILILPSRAEGLPVSVMEGFAAKTTVICTVVGALEHYLKDSKNAIVLSSNSKTSIVEALLRASDKGIRLNLSKSGYETWINSFDVKSTSTTLMTLWEALGKD
jgi:glycosyltransferase involved in cell wall biosynthesis